MVYKAAFASSDGKVVNQHFGHAEQFIIVEINLENKTWKYIETRENIPSCNNGEHSANALEEACSQLQDCRAVFVARIGEGALTCLSQYGIQGVETPYLIENVINALVNSKIKFIA